MSPFDYPPPLLVRKHGPRGYASYSRYLPWLRDEFEFRCVYCLAREQWVIRLGGFAIDHFVPVALDPRATVDYDNLLYTCSACNLAKGMQIVPDPTQVLESGAVTVLEDGRIEARSIGAQILVEILGLNDSHYVRFRRNWMAIVRLVAVHDPGTHRELLRYPDDLPDLSRLRPPGGNARPEGVAHSHFARQSREQLSENY